MNQQSDKKSESDTPRTDFMEIRLRNPAKGSIDKFADKPPKELLVVEAAFARQLERELAEAKESARVWEQRCHEEERNANQLAADISARPSEPTPTGFREWLATYTTNNVFDHGDMAACWHAARRAVIAESVDAALKQSLAATKHLRSDELAGEQDRGIQGLCDQPITALSHGATPQCICTVKERYSGHRLDCPTLAVSSSDTPIDDPLNACCFKSICLSNVRELRQAQADLKEVDAANVRLARQAQVSARDTTRAAALEEAAKVCDREYELIAGSGEHTRAGNRGKELAVCTRIAELIRSA